MRHIVLHGHIFKNAGTTFDWSLRQNFGEGFLDHREDKLMLEDGGSHLRQLVHENQALCALSSHHMTRDLPVLRGVMFLPVYFLRHPLARMRSVYAFEREQQADTPGAVAAKEKNFRDYVSWRMRPDVRRTIRDYQTVYLAGQHDFTSSRDIATAHFPAAVKNLNAAALVGIVERYDESMVVLEEILRESFPRIDLSYIPQNVAAHRKGDECDGATVAGVLDELGGLQKQAIDENSFDLALYQMAGQRLQSRIDRIGAFPAKLESFRSRRQ